MVESSFILINQVIVFLIVSIGLWLAFWVYLADRKSRINQLFFLMGGGVVLWITCYYFTVTSAHVQSILFWGKLAYAAVSVFYLPFYFFFIYFLGLEKKLRYLNKIVIVGGLFFSTASIYTDWIVKGAVLENGKVNLILGSGSIGFYGMAILLSVLVIILLFQKYRKLAPQEKLKIQYFLTGVFIWLSTNFIFNMVLPLLRGDVKYAELGNYSAIFFLGFTAYAIVKRELFGIKLILTDSLVGIIGIISFIFPFFLSTLTLKIIGWGVFGLYSIFGYLLIRYTHREAHQKEILEQKVQERTKELEESKETAEKSKEIAEKRAAELERWYKLTVGRELRMIELKKEIKKLEEKLKKEE